MFGQEGRMKNHLIHVFIVSFGFLGFFLGGGGSLDWDSVLVPW